MRLSTTSTKNMIGLSSISATAQRAPRFKSHQETTVLRDSRAYMPAWSRESRRQLPANIRARKMVQRSDKRRPRGVLAEAAEAGESISSAR
ncbi:hypothetical protein ANCDUO_08913 [Ancylostoma duodenale]|uniref:Uncharacterized protein n=1 Tax=Ancylostoma duodenale TaxID=51022 RepID=A0A0C2CV89_9BILA|nr:hypothetical protein ANCDUO_08913 [Ancylostoma duodenale]